MKHSAEERIWDGAMEGRTEGRHRVPKGLESRDTMLENGWSWEERETIERGE